VSTLPYFDAEAVRAALPFELAMHAIEQGLRNGVDPEDDGPRLFSPAPDGEFLLMPAQGAEFSGLKALTVAPQNPARGLAKIQGLYILYSSDTLAPVAVMEGASLTAIRTPAVTLTAVRHIVRSAAPDDRLPAQPQILIFGAGVQAAGHIEAALVDFPEARFGVIGRRPENVAALVARFPEIELRDRGDDAETAVHEADIIICATSASSPLFDGSLVRDGAIVAAVGTHGRELREVDDRRGPRLGAPRERQPGHRPRPARLGVGLRAREPRRTRLPRHDTQSRSPGALHRRRHVVGGFDLCGCGLR
jgi:ornithine cyclodeaminase